MIRESILMEMDHCLVCGNTYNLHIHEVFFGANNRENSIREKLCISLCSFHHNMSDKGIHFNKEFDLMIKKWAEKKWLEKNNKTIEDFIKIFGKNYLDDEDYRN